MASYRGHLLVSSGTGFVYGGIGASSLGMELPTAIIGAGVTAIGGLLPDLDSDTGVPIRELFGISAAAVPILMLQRLESMEMGADTTLLFMAATYIFIRYGLSRVLKRLTVHRGMFHSIPAMFIAGCLTFLTYENESLAARGFVALAATVGFLSHLLLDEFSSVDFRGLVPRLNKYSGSAVKLFSSSPLATSVCYLMLGVVGYLVWYDIEVQLGHSPMTLISRTPQP